MAKLGELAVYLTANTSAWEKNITKAQRDIKSLASVASTAAIGAGAAVAAFATKSVMAFMTQEQAVISLEAALRANGENVGKYSSKLQSFASSIQDATIFGDELVMSQMSMSMAMGVGADKIEQTTKAAIGLTSYGMDLSTAMLLMAKASQGSFAALSRYGIVVDQTLTKEERYNQILEMTSSKFSIAEANAQSLTGQWNQMQNAVGDLWEVFGKTISSGLGLGSAIGQAKNYVVSFGKAIENMSEEQKSMAMGTGKLVIALSMIPPAIYAIDKAATIAMITGKGMMAAYTIPKAAITSIYGMAAAYGVITKTTTLAAAAQLSYTAALGGMALAAQGLAVVGVAVAAFSLSKWVTEITGLDKALGSLILKLDYFDMLGAQAAGKRGDEADKGLAALAERRRQGLQGSGLPGTGDIKQEVNRKNPFEAERLKAEEEFNNKVMDYGEKQNAIFLKAQEEKEKALEDSDKRLADMREKSFLAAATQEQKINYYLDIRNKLYDDLIAAQDQTSKNDIQSKIIEAELNINDLKDKTKPADETKAAETRLSGAMEKGSVEAYSAIAKSGSKVQDQIAFNTKATMEAAREQVHIFTSIKDQFGVEVARI